MGLLAAGVSLLRIFLNNRDFLQTLVWAEDGLLPLCFYRSSFAGCLLEPYNGYSHFWTRLSGFITYQFELSQWPLITNVIAAFTAGLFSGATYAFLIRSGLPRVVSGFTSVLIIALPLTGLEYVNHIAAANLFAPFLAMLMLSLPAREAWYYSVTSAVLFITALTTPLSFFFLLVLPLQQWRKRLQGRGVGFVYASLTIGLLGQLALMLRSGPHRGLEVSLERLEQYFVNLPFAIQTLFTGYEAKNALLALNSNPEFTMLVGVVIFVVLLLTSVRWAIGRTSRSHLLAPAVGLLVASGLAFSLGPSILIAESLKYFILLLAFLVTGCLFWLSESTSQKLRRFGPTVLALALLGLWVPHLAASDFRATANPAWPQELRMIDHTCAETPAGWVEFTFSPQWRNDPSSPSDDLFGVVSCESLER